MTFCSGVKIFSQHHHAKPLKLSDALFSPTMEEGSSVSRGLREEDAPVAVSARVRKTVKSLQTGFLLTRKTAPGMLKQVSEVVQSSTQKRHEFGVANGIPELFRIMKKFGDDPALLEQCSQILSELSKDDANLVRITKAGGSKVVPDESEGASVSESPIEEAVFVSPKVRKTVKSLQSGFLLTERNAPDLLREVSAVVGSSPQKRREFTAANGLPALAGIMERFEDDPALQDQCKSILSELTRTDDNQVPDVQLVCGIKAVPPCVREDVSPEEIAEAMVARNYQTKELTSVSTEDDSLDTKGPRKYEADEITTVSTVEDDSSVTNSPRKGRTDEITTVSTAEEDFSVTKSPRKGRDDETATVSTVEDDCSTTKSPRKDRADEITAGSTVEDHFFSVTESPRKDRLDEITTSSTLGEASFVIEAPVEDNIAVATSRVREAVKSLQMGFSLTEPSAPELLREVSEVVSSSPQRRRQFGAANGIQALSSFMKKFEYDRDLQELCRQILSELGNDAENKMIIARLYRKQKEMEPKTREDESDTMTSARSDQKKVSTRVRKTVKSLQMQFLLTEKNTSDLLREVSKVVCSGAEQRHAFGVANGIPGVVAIMKKFEDNPPIQEQSTSIVRMLSADAENRAMVAWAGGIETILMAMLRHTGTSMQEIGCGTIAILAKNVENKESISSFSGVEVVLTAMNAYLSNAPIQAQGCLALAHLAESHAQNSYKIAACGGTKAIVAAVKEHGDVRDVQLNGCLAIRHLAATIDANRGSVASAGGILTTLAAMREFKGDPDLQETACCVLWNLTISHKQNAESIMESRGLSTILASMREHERVAAIQEAGCGVLRNLTDDDRCGAAIGAEGGIGALLTAMRQFEENAIVQEQGCAALSNLACIHDNLIPMAGAGGIAIIVAAMKRLEDNLDVQKNGCRALQTLATSDQNKISIAAAGGIGAILSAMRRHDTKPAVQGLAVRVLSSLAINKRNKEAMKSNGAEETIERAIQTHPKNVLLQSVGKQLLLALDPSTAAEEDR